MQSPTSPIPFTPPVRPEFLVRPLVRPQPRPQMEPRKTRADQPAPAEAPPKTFTAATGVMQALPIVSGYLPVAFTLGVLCSAAGLSFFATFLMSAIVYAGSAQFVAVSLFAASAPVWSIVLTTFIINFRHFLMSTAMAPKLKTWPRRLRILFGAQMTDETFAVLMNHLGLHPKTEARHVFAVNLSAQTAWVTGTVLGYSASAWLPDLKTIGMDFALPGMFIALIVLQLKDRWLAMAGAGAASMALLFERLGAGHLAVLLAAMLGATVAAMLELRAKPLEKRRS